MAKSPDDKTIHDTPASSFRNLFTETIDFLGLFPDNLTESGSFDLRGFRLTSLGKLLSALPIPALVVSGDASIVFANDACERLGGASVKFEASPFCSLFPRSRDAAAFQDIIKKVFSTRKLQVSEALVEVGANRVWGRMNFRSLRLGENRYVLVLIEDLTLEKKHILLVEANKEILRQNKERYEKELQEQTAQLRLTNEKLLEEIEERSKIQSALEESKDNFNSIVEKTSDGIAVLDRHGIILYANRSAARFLGKLSESLTGERLPIPLKPGEVSEIDIIRLSGEPGKAEIYVNRTQWNGKASFLITFRDITDRKRTQQELLRVQKLESLEVIAGGLAHDFNNLLTANVANISLAKIRSDRDSPVYEALLKAERAASKARELTKQLLTFTKGRPPVKKSTSLVPLIKETAALCLSGSNVKCKFSLNDDLWATEIEPSQISMVFQNLIINAKQAMPDGGTLLIKGENILVGAEPREGVAQSSEGRYIRIIVRDTGPGISPQNLSKIFDPYFTTKSSGSGLGLATSYSIIKKHEGRIEVESRVGSGTSFFVYLPASDKYAETNDLPDELPVHGRGNILIMEHELDIREAAGNLLSLLGYQVRTAANGEEAVENYKAAMGSKIPFDVVILDLTVPGGMGGKEATRKILEIDPKARIILSTGHTNDPILTNFGQHGFAEAIAKPYSAVELGAVLRKVIISQARSHD